MPFSELTNTMDAGTPRRPRTARKDTDYALLAQGRPQTTPRSPASKQHDRDFSRLLNPFHKHSSNHSVHTPHLHSAPAAESPVIEFKYSNTSSTRPPEIRVRESVNRKNAFTFDSLWKNLVPAISVVLSSILLVVWATLQTFLHLLGIGKRLLEYIRRNVSRSGIVAGSSITVIVFALFYATASSSFYLKRDIVDSLPLVVESVYPGVTIPAEQVYSDDILTGKSGSADDNLLEYPGIIDPVSHQEIESENQAGVLTSIYWFFGGRPALIAAMY